MAVPGFRIFYLDERSGRITGSHDFSANDDLDAIREAEDHGTGAAMELWSGQRRIKRWDAAQGGEGQP
jgi:hypothetical protein